MGPLLGHRDRVPLPEENRHVLLQRMPRHPGERDATFARGLAASQPDRELPRNGLRVLLERLEEGPDLVEEDGPRWKLCLQFGVASQHGIILRRKPTSVSPEYVLLRRSLESKYERALGPFSLTPH